VKGITKSPLGGKKSGPNPIDRGKGGTRRSLLTDGKGVPLAIEAAEANRYGMKLVGPTLNKLIGKRLPLTQDAVQGLCMDKGYDFEVV